MSTSKKDSLLEKIKNLIEKAKSTDSAAEADAFMQGAQRLSMQYNIDINALQDKKVSSDGKIVEVKVAYQEDYEKSLISYIAHFNFCKVIIFGEYNIRNEQDLQEIKSESLIRIGDSYKRLALIGSAEDTDIVLYLYSFYRHAIMQASIKEYSSFLELSGISSLEEDGIKIKLPKSHKQDFINSYLMGCAKGVFQKLCDIDRAYQSQIDGNSVVINKRAKVDAYLKVYYPNLTTSRSKDSTKNKSAMRKGIDDGYKMSHSKAIN